MYAVINDRGQYVSRQKKAHVFRDYTDFVNCAKLYSYEDAVKAAKRIGGKPVRVYMKDGFIKTEIENV